MTTDELALHVLPLDYLPTADEAGQHRAHVTELYRLQQAGLLPDFASCFTPAAAEPEPGQE